LRVVTSGAGVAPAASASHRRAASVVKLAGSSAACPGLQKPLNPGCASPTFQQRQVPGVPSGVIVVNDGKHPIASTRGDVRQ
jgi:hypothetical protein